MVRMRIATVGGNRPGRTALGIVVAVLSATLVEAKTPLPTQESAQSPAPQAQSGPTTRVFGSDAGLVLNFVKTDKAADFEAVMAKLKEALAKSEKPERKQQAESWKVFKAVEPGPPGSALYVFIIDPPVKGADYTVSTILAEGFPQEVQALYKQYAESYSQGQNFVNLTLVAALGK